MGFECTHPGRPRDAQRRRGQLEGNQSMGPQAYGNVDRVSMSWSKGGPMQHTNKEGL